MCVSKFAVQGFSPPSLLARTTCPVLTAPVHLISLKNTSGRVLDLLHHSTSYTCLCARTTKESKVKLSICTEILEEGLARVAYFSPAMFLA